MAGGGYQRVVIEGVRPTVDAGRFPAKAAVSLPLQVSADVFAEGHDLLLAWVRFGKPSRAGAAPRGWRAEPMQPLGNDRWEAWIEPRSAGPLAFDVVGVVDDYGSWLRGARIKLAAGDDVALELAEGASMARQRSRRRDVPERDRQALAKLAAELDAATSPQRRLSRAAQPAVLALMARTADLSQATIAGPFSVWVDRELAAFSAWYEMFPRSEAATPGSSGTFASAAHRLPAIAEMGFDIVYLPPIHPIGTTARKGANNALEAGPTDPGSPWAIGGPEGGHTAIHPDLGDLADFTDFVSAARRAGLEVALDFAAQCSPDHPWVTEHPEWFKHRPDGSIKYAENPPKKYQDIYPLDFETADRTGLWNALRDVLLFWSERGVHVFRVDNPHTKPFAFWEWVIAEVRRRHPGTLFLSEAFTRPRVMHRLAKLGFTQSYTYFTWRTRKWEIEEYLRELSAPPAVDYFRPNFWPNTPDILHAVLQEGGPAAFRLRLVLAALGAPSWGMYSGFELFESEAVRPGSEEYLNSEKYSLRPRQWDRADSLAPLVGQVNSIRRRHRGALAQLSRTHLHHIGNDQLVCFSRSDPGRSDVILVVVNLDPAWAQSGMTWLDLEALGLQPDTIFQVHDELTDTSFTWRGPQNFVRLDPAIQPAHIFHLRSL